MCSIGLEGWKIVSRFNYILFQIFPSVSQVTPHPHTVCFSFHASREFYVFFSSFFQFPLEWKSLEHYCNFFPSYHKPPSIHTNRYTHKMNGFFCSLFRITNCCCWGILWEAICEAANGCQGRRNCEEFAKIFVQIMLPGLNRRELSATFHPLNMMMRLSCRLSDERKIHISKKKKKCV